VWDQLASYGLFPVGIGVSDSHGGPEARWRTGENNFVSWIYAPSASAADLIEGLRRGAVYFGDITLFDGRIDLVSERGARMGEVVVTDRSNARMTIMLSGITPGDRLSIVEQGDEVARPVLASESVAWEHGVELSENEATSMRVGLFGETGAARVFSNAVVFVPEVPEGGIAPGRARVDLQGVQAMGFEEFRLEEAAMDAESLEPVLVLKGRAADGRIEVKVPDARSVLGVEFVDGLSGIWTRSEDGARIREIEGAGAVRVVLSR